LKEFGYSPPEAESHLRPPIATVWKTDVRCPLGEACKSSSAERAIGRISPCPGGVHHVHVIGRADLGQVPLMASIAALDGAKPPGVPVAPVCHQRRSQRRYSRRHKIIAPASELGRRIEKLTCA